MKSKYTNEECIEKIKTMRDMRVVDIAAALETNKKRITKLLRIIRTETGELSRNQKSAVTHERVKEYLKGRDLTKVTTAQIAEALNITKRQAESPLRKILLSEGILVRRSPITTSEPNKDENAPKPKKLNLFKVDGDKLFWFDNNGSAKEVTLKK